MEFARVAPFLDRDSFEVDRFPSAEGSLELISQVPFEALLVRYPPPDIRIDRFLGAVRGERSPCRTAPVVLLADERVQGDAERWIGHGANRVLSLGGLENDIQRTLSTLLNVAPRKDARFIIRLEVRVGDSHDMIMCQTENVSASGMLIRTDERYAKGTQIELEFTLPQDPRPVRVVAEVMRVTTIGREEVSGIGVRFLSFSGDSQRRFIMFLGSQ
ncbi:MAG: PilZ domain-containing protein [Acidobacteriota bacterium]